MHKVILDIQKKINIEILHIADTTADELEKANIKKVILLGTKYTMTQDFYKERLLDRDIEVITPDSADIEIINSIIYDELVLGIIKDDSRKKYLKIINKLKVKGAEGIILGCTEIGLLIKQKHLTLPIFDTTEIHANHAALFAISTKKIEE